MVYWKTRKEKMRKIRILIFLFFVLLSMREAMSNPLVSQQEIITPAFIDLGDLIYFYKNAQGKICLNTLNFEESEPATKSFSFGINANPPLIKEDRKGKIWLAWEEWEEERSQIFLGELKGKEIVSSQIVSKKEGFNLSPDLCFDGNNYPWMIWINYTDSCYRVFVQEVRSGRTWLINSGNLSSASSPKILFDHNNDLWTFWNGKDDGEEEIFWRVFSQNSWSALRKLNLDNRSPNIHPDVILDQKGFIWLVWSGYDGQDYEIYCAFWDGKNWSEKIKMTNNFHENDIFPSISLVGETIPLLAWTQCSDRGDRICLKYRESEAWSEIIKISSPHSQIAVPRMVVEGERIGAVWQSEHGIQARCFFFNQLRGKNLSSSSSFQGTQIIYNPSLAENKYIGFGDSITYGYINHEPFPEKGYLPCLSILLNQSFGETEVINEGWPGELTEQGLSRIESVISKHEARYLLLMEGTNDIVFNNISMATAAFNLREMVKKCLDFGVFPAISTILPRRDPKWSNVFYRDRIYSLNQKIRQIASDLLIPLVDQFELFNNYPAEQGGCESLLSEDGKHPSEKGYQFMAENWFGEIRNFPFPPLGIRIRSREGPDRPRKIGGSQSSSRLGNLISWEESAKIFDKNKIKGYKIYRRKTEQESDGFQLIALICDQWRYLDKEIMPSEYYIYTISTLRTDGMEGPCSEPVKSKDWR